jgi:hypothetical protein
VPHRVGDVLDQGAAEPDVEDLRAPADAEHRDPAFEGAVEHGELGRVPLGTRLPRAGVCGGAVAVGADVRATCEHDGVEAVDGRGRLRDRREQHRHPTGGDHDVRVGAGEQHGRVVPDPVAGVLLVRGDPDDGARPGKRLRAVRTHACAPSR